MESLGPVGLVAFFLSLALGFICFFFIFKTVIQRKVAIKVMAESLGDAAGEASIIALVSITLGVLGISFFAVCTSLFIFSNMG